MTHIQRLNAPIDTTDPSDEKILSMSDNTPYMMAYGDSSMTFWYSSSLLYPIVTDEGTLYFSKDYSTINYNSNTKTLEIDGAASEFVSYDANTKTLVFSRTKTD